MKQEAVMIVGPMSDISSFTEICNQNLDNQDESVNMKINTALWCHYLWKLNQYHLFIALCIALGLAHQLAQS